MFLHEHKAKEFLRRYGLKAPLGGLARNRGDAEAVVRALNRPVCYVKAQIQAGGRGQAGGIKSAGTYAEAGKIAEDLIGRRLVTKDTGPKGLPVEAVLIEERVDSRRELYLALYVDRGTARVTVMTSLAGGEAVEADAAANPAHITRYAVDPLAGMTAALAGEVAAGLSLDGRAAGEAAALVEALYRAFIELDASLIEINPLAVTPQGELVALDVKMSVDDNALHRQTELALLADQVHADPSEREAADYGINCVRFDGDIAVMANGAGLALATLDSLAQQGGRPATFMDLRPVASRQEVAAGVAMIARDAGIKAFLINVVGGGVMRCDTIAEGIAGALRGRPKHLPVILRAVGTNADICRKSLKAQGIAVTFADDIDEAVRLAVAAARG
jgi:succinyl-CoA synthetase beta subunit